jgi:HD-GYP domain-containing protein (c-di-GMP phosphodiesterase class II)
MRDKIPVEARIFSVVDSYDAMTSDRPYRAAMSHEMAMEELRANSGSQFDPDVVASFERLMAERPELREHPHGHHAISALHDDHDLADAVLRDRSAPPASPEDPAEDEAVA